MNKVPRFLSYLLLILAVCVAIVAPVTADGGTDWKQFHKDAANTGNTTSTVSDDNSILWFSDAIGAVESSSVVVANNHVFVYCNDNVTCLDEFTGAVEWTSVALDSSAWDSWSSPAYHDGNIFMGSGTKVYSINGTDGSLNWTYTMPLAKEACNGSVTIADGKVFASDWDGHHYYCVDEATGTKLWEFEVSGYAQGTPAYDDGKVYLTSYEWVGGHVYCIYSDNGSQVWHQTFPLDIGGSATVANNVVYVAEYNFGGEGKLYALNTDNGSILWASDNISSTDSTPAVADGKVYVCGGCPGYWDLATYCFSADSGTQLWKVDDIGGWTCSVAVASNAVVVGNVKDPYSGAGSYGTYALNSDNGTTIWSSSYGGSSPVVANGRVFTIAQGRVYAFGTPSASLPDLVPMEIGLPAYISDVASANITALVQNSGTGNATSIKVTFTANTTLIETKTISSLAAGAETSANFTWTPAIGDYTLKVTVDPDNAIPESNVGNNELTKAVSVPHISVPDMTLNLVNGWNFISTPKELKNGHKTAEQVFRGVDTDNHSIFVCAVLSGWQALASDNTVAPLDGIWIYSSGSCEVYFAFDTDPLRVPPTKQLYSGWSAIGFSDTEDAPANSTLTSVEAQWAYLMGFSADNQTYEDSIINNDQNGGDHDESKPMYPGRGYWLYMTADGELAAIGN